MRRLLTLLLVIIPVPMIGYSQEPAKIRAAQSMSTARAFHEGIYIPIEGSYLVCGGINGNSTLDSCEFFSIQNLSWSGGPKMKVARKNPPLANIFGLSKQGSEQGSVLIVGGEDRAGSPLVKTELYDIQTKSIDQFNDLPTPHSGDIVFYNPSAEPLVFIIMIGPGKSITKLAIVNKQDIKWLSSPNSLSFPRDGHRFTAIPDYQVLVVGGGSKTLEIYNYKDDTVKNSKDLKFDRRGHQVVNLSNSSILIAGGINENGNLVATTEIYNPINDEVNTAGDMHIPRRDFRLTLLHNNKVLASGGIDIDGNPVSALEIFDPSTGKWTLDLNLLTGRANHTAELIGAEGVLICGGNSGGNTASLRTCEIYTPEKICEPGRFSCEGNWIVKCNSFGDGTNKTNECAGGCKDGQCIGQCTEGERRCRDIGVKVVVEQCNATGGWVLLEQCEESCKNGYCDGDIPRQDTGIDTGRDILVKDNPVADENPSADIRDDDIVVNIDTGAGLDSNTTLDAGIDKTDSDGCSCSLIE